nr:MAG TPA: hypothetical protein [Caudoviricetes sp.]
MEELERLLKFAKYSDHDKECFLIAIKNRFENEKFNLASNFIEEREEEIKKAGIGVNESTGYDFYIITISTEEISDAKMVLAIDGKVQVKNANIVFCCKEAEVIAKKCSWLNTYNKCSARALECNNVVAYCESQVLCYNTRSVALYQKSFGELRGKSRSVAYDESSISCHDNSECELYNKTKGYFYQFSKGTCYEESEAHAYMDSELKLHEESKGFIFDNVTSECNDSSSLQIHGTKETILKFGTRARVFNKSIDNKNVGCITARKGSVVYIEENPNCDIVTKTGAVIINKNTKKVTVKRIKYGKNNINGR